MSILDDLSNNHDRIALLIGNGPNQVAGIMPSWKDLLATAADRPIDFQIEGLSNTEVYDLVELHSREGADIKQRVKERLAIVEGSNLAIHRRLMEFAEQHRSPVLTTNFDEAFERSVNSRLYHITTNKFTRFYTWKTYYGHQQHTLPTDGYGIWKIHGDVKYKDSIRLGLTDYMGSAGRARKLIHADGDRLFRGKRQDHWPGHQTWLHIWFNLPIIILGFGYGIDEIFLRWLLIERKRYLNIYHSPMEVYYISRRVPAPAIGNLMQNLGVEIILIDHYSDIYGNGVIG